MPNELIKGINLILFMILLLAVFCSALVALLVSKSISNPIVKLSQQARSIGSGDFEVIENSESSVEMAELTNRMNEMSQRLKNTNHAQKTFFQNAAHELRTPLMSIGRYAEGIAKGIFKDPQEKAKIICEETQRLTMLVAQLLTLSKIENMEKEVPLENHHLYDLVCEYIKRSKGLALQKNIDIHLEGKHDLMATINEPLFSQGFLNVLGNALDYAQSSISVMVDSKNNKAIITIKDDGKGIDSSDLPHVFERFYKGKTGNFGLGLTIAKSAITSFKEDIAVSNGDNGAIFKIIIPKAN